MGNSHFDSNVIALDGTETITGFATISATALKGSLTGNTAGTHTGAVVGNVTGNTAGTHTGAVVGDVTGNATGTYQKATSYFQMGDHQYIMFGAANVQADVEAAATAIDASCKGSLYLSSGGTGWIMTDDDTAASITLT